jgi:hypothetical protein
MEIRRSVRQMPHPVEKNMQKLFSSQESSTYPKIDLFLKIVCIVLFLLSLYGLWTLR